jgi:hypothetical protein
MLYIYPVADWLVRVVLWFTSRQIIGKIKQLENTKYDEVTRFIGYTYTSSERLKLKVDQYCTVFMKNTKLPIYSTCGTTLYSKENTHYTAYKLRNL